LGTNFETKITASEQHIESVESAIEIGLKRNPELQSKLDELHAARLRPKISGGRPDPIVSIRLNGIPSKMHGHTFDQNRFAITQSIPFFGTLGHKKHQANTEIKLLKTHVTQLQNAIRLAIEKTYFNLVLNYELTQIASQNRQIIDNMIAITDIKYQSGTSLEANILKATVSKGKIDAQLYQLAHEKVMLIAHLKKWIGIPADTTMNLSLQYPSASYLNANKVSTRDITHTIQYIKAHLSEETVHQDLVIAKDRYRPNLIAQVELWDSPGVKNQYAGHLAMNIPWFNHTHHASIKTAQLRERAAIKSTHNQINSIHQTLTTKLSELNTALKLITLYETSLLKHAQQSVRRFQHAFEVNNATFIDYFESEMTYHALAINYAKYRNNAYTTRAEINAMFENRGM
jgi:outer membrane protein TolC